MLVVCCLFCLFCLFVCFFLRVCLCSAVLSLFCCWRRRVKAACRANAANPLNSSIYARCCLFFSFFLSLFVCFCLFVPLFVCFCLFVCLFVCLLALCQIRAEPCPTTDLSVCLFVCFVCLIDILSHVHTEFFVCLLVCLLIRLLVCLLIRGALSKSPSCFCSSVFCFCCSSVFLFVRLLLIQV